jgi:hypothetical protein
MAADQPQRRRGLAFSVSAIDVYHKTPPSFYTGLSTFYDISVEKGKRKSDLNHLETTLQEGLK